jgi:hypothetical protein
MVEKLPASKSVDKLVRNSAVRKDGYRVCVNCKEEKPIDCFYKNVTAKNGYGNVCKPCDNKRTQDKEKRMANESVLYFIKRLISGKKSATKEKRCFDKDFDADFLYNLYLKQNGLCAITKEKMTNIAGKGKVATNISIDRIDNSISYTRNNVQLVCYIVNIMKNSFTIDELKDWSYKIYKNI